MRRYPLRHFKRSEPESGKDSEALAPHVDAAEGVRNAKRQRANAVRASLSCVRVIFGEAVETFRLFPRQVVADLLDDACRHWDLDAKERRQYELRDGGGAVLPGRGLLELLLQAEGGEGQATLHLLQRNAAPELHQCWAFDASKDLTPWAVDPAYAFHYRSITQEHSGVLTIASTQSVPVTKEDPLEVSKREGDSLQAVLIAGRKPLVGKFGRHTWTVSVSDFEVDEVEPDVFAGMAKCSGLGLLYDRMYKQKMAPEEAESRDVYAAAGIDASMAISYAVMGFMWNAQQGALMMFEVLPSGAWRFRHRVQSGVTHPVVYVRRRYAVDRRVTIRSGLPPPAFCLL